VCRGPSGPARERGIGRRCARRGLSRRLKWASSPLRSWREASKCTSPISSSIGPRLAWVAGGCRSVGWAAGVESLSARIVPILLGTVALVQIHHDLLGRENIRLRVTGTRLPARYPPTTDWSFPRRDYFDGFRCASSYYSGGPQVWPTSGPDIPAGHRAFGTFLRVRSLRRT
jgi:hypothetical protein